MHFFTSITANYLPKARVLARSVKQHCQDAVFHLVLSDQLPAGVDPSNEPFDNILYIDDLDVPVEHLESWIFMHTVVELCTAVKGQTFVKLFESTDADKIVYLDPDIAVFHDLDELSGLLDQHSVVLTPHQVEPETTLEGMADNEMSSLKHGVFNLGFLAIRRSEEGLRFAKWWRDRLVHFCYDDIPSGIFTDQKWVDLAPAFFEDLHILRDKAYNVATWNLSHRTVTRDEDGTIRVDGTPLKFYHFSGFDSGAQELMLNKYGNNNPVLRDLRAWYLEESEKAGQSQIGKHPCVYGFYSNGEPITKQQRLLYRTRQDVIRAFPRPATLTEDKHCYYWWYKHEVVSEDANLQEQELLRLRKELNDLLNSSSWKLTEPLRRLKRMFSK